MDEPGFRKKVLHSLADISSRLERIEGQLAPSESARRVSDPVEKNVSEMPADMSILVVDDEKDIREVFREALTSSGYGVFEASKAIEALEFLKRRTVDLMLLDIFMKGGSGVDLLKLLKRRSIQVPTVVISGHLSAGLTERLIGLGVRKILAKPIKPSRMMDEIQGVLQN